MVVSQVIACPIFSRDTYRKISFVRPRKVGARCVHQTFAKERTKSQRRAGFAPGRVGLVSAVLHASVSKR